MPKNEINERVEKAAQILELTEISIDGLVSCQEASASAPRWAGRSCASRPS